MRYVRYLEQLDVRTKVLLTQFDCYFNEQIKTISDLEDEDEISCKEITLEKSKKFVTILLKRCLFFYNFELEFPRIKRGIKGDVDLDWNNEIFKLLISIPESDDDKIGLYGKNYIGDTIQLDFYANRFNSKLIIWLKILPEIKKIIFEKN